MQYPNLYQPVFVKYRIKGTNIHKISKMWLSINSYGDYIWTESNNNTQTWENDLIEVINWWHCSTNSNEHAFLINSTKSM